MIWRGVAVVLAAAGVARADVFNMPAGQTSVRFATVGDPGNVGDTVMMNNGNAINDGSSGYGAVSYAYSMGTFDVTAAQYVQFLNAVAWNTDPYGLYNPSMNTAGGITDGNGYPVACGIFRSGTAGSYTYRTATTADSINGYHFPASAANLPVNWDSWGDAARFVNWLQNGQPGLPGAASYHSLTLAVEGTNTTEAGAYTLNGAMTTAALFTVTRNAGAKYFIPSENEWYKAAYYKGGGTNAGYWYYGTQASTSNPPSSTLSTTGTNNANFNSSGSHSPNLWALSPVGYYAGSHTAYGTYDQGGDLYNFTDTAITVSSSIANTLGEGTTTVMGIRGGSFHWNNPGELAANFRFGGDPAKFGHGRTFRIAAVLPIWNGAGTGTNWSTAANWGGTAGNWTTTSFTASGSTTTSVTSGGTVAVAPVEGLPIEFGPLAAGGNTTSNNDMAAGTVLSGITFGSGAPNYNLQGNSINLAGAVSNQSGSDQTMGLPLQLIAGGGTFDTGATNTLTLSGSLSGSGMALAKTGAGTLVLSASNNTYSGGTNVSAGTLKLAAASPNNIPNSPTISVPGGATLDVTGLTGGGISLASGQTLSLGGTVAGGVTVLSGGTLNGSGGPILPGGGGSVTIQNGGHLSPHATSSATGMLTIGSLAATSALNLNDGSVLDLNVGNAADDVYVYGNVNLAGTTTVNLTGLSGATAGGSYEIMHYTGSLSGGTADLAVGTLSGLGGSYAAFSTTVNGLFVNFVNPNLKTWTGAVNGTWDTIGTQNWTDYQGNPAPYLQGSPADAVVFSDAALAQGNGSVTVQAGGVSPAAVNFTNTAGTYTVGGGAINGAATTLTKIGAGTVVLTGANTYGGGTAINGGTVSVSADNNLGTGPLGFNGGTLQITGSSAFTTSKAVTLSAGGGTVWVDNSAGATLAGSITGSGGLTKAGAYPLTLTATSSYTGGTTVSGGTLTLSGSGTISGSSAIVVNLGCTFYLNNNTGADNTARTGATAPVTVNGGTFSYLGNAAYSGTESEQFGALTLGPGQSTVSVSCGLLAPAGTADHAQIYFGSSTTLSSDLVRTPMSGAMVNFTATVPGQGGPGGSYYSKLWGSTTGPGDFIAFGGTAGNGPGSINGPADWIVVNGHDFARWSGSHGIHEQDMGSGGTPTVTIASSINGPAGYVILSGTGALAQTCTASESINSLAVQSSATGTATLTGYKVNIQDTSSGALDSNGGICASGSAPFTPSGGYTITGGTITAGNSASETSAELLVWIDSGSTTINSVIQDNGAPEGFGSTLLSKNGSGTLLLGGANTYSYGTTLNGGVLSFANGTLPFNSSSPNIWFYGGTLQWASNNTQDVSAGIAPISSGYAAMIDTNGNPVTFADDLSGGGGLVKLGANTLTLAASNTYSGGTTISAGTLQLGDGTSNNGSVQGNILNQSVLVFANPWPQTYAGVISGSGSLTMTGPNTLILTASNTYSGGTTVSSGTLQLGDGSASNGYVPNNITVNSGAVLAFANPLPQTFAGVISGSGSLTMTGPGTLILTAGNTYSGGTTINGGTLSVAADNNLGAVPGSVTPGSLVINGGTLGTSGSFALSASRGVALGPAGGSGAGTIDVANATILTYGGSIANNSGGTGGLVKADSGTLILTAANTYTGGTTINAGTLQLGNGNPGNDGTLQSSTITINANGALVFDLCNSQTYSGAISGNGSLTQAGPGALILTGTSGSGATAIQTGSRLQIGNGGSSGTLGTGAVADSGSLVVNCSGEVDFDDSPGQTISGPGSLVVQGGSALALGSGNTYQGGTTLGNAAINFASGGLGSGPLRVDPGSGQSGTLVFEGGSGGTRSDLAGTAITLASGTVVLDLQNNTVSLNAGMTGGGGLVVNDSFGTGTLALGALASNYGGGTTIARGILQIEADNLLPTAGVVSISGGSTVTINSTPYVHGGTLDLAGHNQTLGGLTGGAAGDGGISGIVTNSAGSTTSVLTIGGGSSTFAGVIQNGAGQVALLSSGGTLTLAGSNTYSGGTMVSNGLLAAENAGAIPSGSLLSIGANGSVVLGTPGAAEPLGQLSGDPQAGAPGPLGSQPSGGSINPVPEPGTLALLAAAAACGFALRLRRKGLRIRN
jgi:fibronectin-binding autotransporter adhesin